MSIVKDDAMYGVSGYERREGDRYWTQPWVTDTLLTNWALPQGRVWEPAAGRGDIVSVLYDFAFDTFASDIDMSEYLGPDPCAKMDFLTTHMPSLIPLDVKAVVTNPPYAGSLADQFVTKAIGLIENGKIDCAAFLLRAEWNHAAKRAWMFDHDLYAAEIVLRKRPRWDWWYEDTSPVAPRHNFSWFIWDRNPMGGTYPVQIYQRLK